MKTYISVDMEGISGVVDGKQTLSGKEGEDFGRFRDLMAGDVNAAVEGALEAGATAVVVNDGHAGMRNLLITALHPAAELVTGSPKPLSMVEGLDDSFQAVFLIGYHARAGTPGVLNHTYTGYLMECRFNGQPVGETGLSAAVAGHFGVPVALVTGDDLVGREALDILGPVRTVAVKQALGRYAARCLHPERARALIRTAAREALDRLDSLAPYRPRPPLRVEVDLRDTGQADAAMLLPGLDRTGGRTVAFTAPDPLWAYRMIRVILRLGAG